MKKNWETKKVGEILKLEYGKPLVDSDRNPNGRYAAYGANGIKTRTDKFYYDKPSIIVGRKGSAGVITITEEKFWPLDVTYFVTYDNKQYDLKYLYLLLKLLDLPKMATGVKPGINRNDVYSLIVIVPPLVEQKRIVGVLDEKFGAIEELKKITEQQFVGVKELFESRLNEMFRTNDNNWICEPLKFITTKIGSGATPKGGKTAYKKDGISLIRSLNVHDTFFKYPKLAHLDEQQAKKLNNVTVQKNDVLLNITGASIARCCIVPEDILPARVNQHVSIIRSTPNKINSNFLQLLLVSQRYKSLLLGIGEGGATRQAITKAQLESFEVRYPSDIPEQIKIVKELMNFQKN